MNQNELRPVVVFDQGKKIKGFFHRFVFQMADYRTDTKALIELEDGRLRYYDPYFVQFTDRCEKRLDNSL